MKPCLKRRVSTSQLGSSIYSRLWGYGHRRTHNQSQLISAPFISLHTFCNWCWSADWFVLVSTQRNRSLGTTEFVWFFTVSKTHSEAVKREAVIEFKFSCVMPHLIGSRCTFFHILCFYERVWGWAIPQCIHKETLKEDQRERKKFRFQLHSGVWVARVRQLRQTTIRAAFHDSALVKYNPLQHCREWMVCWNMYFRMTQAQWFGRELSRLSNFWQIVTLKIF